MTTGTVLLIILAFLVGLGIGTFLTGPIRMIIQYLKRGSPIS
jgi:uncharacterized protein YneF (UPF0154 family)